MTAPACGGTEPGTIARAAWYVTRLRESEAAALDAHACGDVSEVYSASRFVRGYAARAGLTAVVALLGGAR